MTRYAKIKLKYSLNENFNLLPYVELDRFVTLTGAQAEWGLRNRIYMMSCMVVQLLLLQGSISNLTCHIDLDSTQLDLDTWSCRFVHRNCHRKKIFKTIQQSSLHWSVDKQYHTRIKQNYEMSKTCATPSWKIKKHNKFSLGQRSETGKIFLTVCKPQSYLTDIYVLPINVVNP
jgi:hypothetical protein